MSWAIHLTHALWQGTLTGLAILAVVRLLPASSPRLRHALVSLALLKFVIPPMLPLPTGVFSAAPVGVLRPGGIDGRVLTALMMIHVAGIAFMLSRLACEAFRLHRIRSAAEDAGAFLLTDAVTVPMTTGSTILIPRALYSRLTAAELGHVLAHEREHVRRRDVRTSLLHSFVAAVWWFHPLVHLLVREARTLREECCDDAVMPADRAGYAATLLHAARCVSGSTPAMAAAIAESPHSLVRRIRRMASARYAPSSRLGLAARAFVFLAALLLLPGVRMSHVVHVHHHTHHH